MNGRKGKLSIGTNIYMKVSWADRTAGYLLIFEILTIRNFIFSRYYFSRFYYFDISMFEIFNFEICFSKFWFSTLRFSRFVFLCFAFRSFASNSVILGDPCELPCTHRQDCLDCFRICTIQTSPRRVAMSYCPVESYKPEMSIAAEHLPLPRRDGKSKIATAPLPRRDDK